MKSTGFFSLLCLLPALICVRAAHGSGSRPACHLEGLQALCASLPQTDRPYIELPRGRQLLNPNRKDRYAPDEPMTEEQKSLSKARVDERFVWAREQMIRQILAGRSESEAGEQQRAWIARLRNLVLKFKDCEHQAGGGGRYNTHDHTVEICYRSGLSSDAQLSWLLAHEAGHAIDGCSCQNHHYARTGPLPSPAGMRMSAAARSVFDNVRRAPHFTFDLTGDPGARELQTRLRDWEQRGLVRRIDSGMSAREFPLTPVMACLRNEGFITPEAVEIQDGESCSQSGSASETPSDMWGAKIAGLFMAQNPPRSDLERLASLSNDSVMLMCSNRRGPKPVAQLNAPTWSQVRPSPGRYINERDRDEATLLSDENMQRALGCAPLPDRGRCMRHFESSLQQWGQRSQSPATGAGAQSPERTGSTIK
jgi:hypothetical protein